MRRTYKLKSSHLINLPLSMDAIPNRLGILKNMRDTTHKIGDKKEKFGLVCRKFYKNKFNQDINSNTASFYLSYSGPRTQANLLFESVSKWIFLFKS